MSINNFTRGKVKVEVGVCQGKKLYDKRETLKNKNKLRIIERAKAGKF